MKISAREKRLLLLLVVIASLAGLRALWRFAASSGGIGESGRPVAARGGGPGRRAGQALPATLVELRSDLLEAEPRPFVVGRDLFRYAPPPPPPGPTAAELERLRRLAEERRAAAAREADSSPAAPRPPEITVRFLGSFGPGDGKIAVFATRSGEEILNARVGDALEGKFIVDQIGYESVDLRFVGFPDLPARRLPVER